MVQEQGWETASLVVSDLENLQPTLAFAGFAARLLIASLSLSLLREQELGKVLWWIRGLDTVERWMGVGHELIDTGTI